MKLQVRIAQRRVIQTALRHAASEMYLDDHPEDHDGGGEGTVLRDRQLHEEVVAYVEACKEHGEPER